MWFGIWHSPICRYIYVCVCDFGRHCSFWTKKFQWIITKLKPPVYPNIKSQRRIYSIKNVLSLHWRTSMAGESNSNLAINSKFSSNSYTTHFWLRRIMERTEEITIFENERCRKIYAMQHRTQLFFQKDNICAGKTNLENIKIVRTISGRWKCFVLSKSNFLFLCTIFVQIENQWSIVNLCRWRNREWWT